MTGDVSFSRSVKVAVAAVLDWKAVLLLAVIHKYLVGGGPWKRCFILCKLSSFNDSLITSLGPWLLVLFGGL